MAKVKVRAIEVPPGMLVAWWRDLFNFTPKTREEEKSAATVIERIKRARGFNHDEKKETIGIEATTCPKCKKDFYHADYEGEDRDRIDAGGCPECKAQLEPITALVVVIERHLRSFLWDHRKAPLQKPCPPRERAALRKEAEVLGKVKDWEDLAEKSAPEPLPDEDELEFEEGPIEDEEEDGDEKQEKHEPKLVKDEDPKLLEAPAAP